MADDDDLRFKAVRTNGHDEIVVRTANLLIGRAAYETARRVYEHIDFRDGARIIARSEPETIKSDDDATWSGALRPLVVYSVVREYLNLC